MKWMVNCKTCGREFEPYNEEAATFWLLSHKVAYPLHKVEIQRKEVSNDSNV